MGDVPVDEALLVDSVNRHDYLGSIEACDVLRKDVILDEHRHQITSREKFHQHVEILCILKGRKQLDDPGAVGLCENIPLGSDVGHLVPCDHMTLYQGLQGVDSPILLPLDKLDLAECALAD